MQKNPAVTFGAVVFAFIVIPAIGYYAVQSDELEVMDNSNVKAPAAAKVIDKVEDTRNGNISSKDVQTIAPLVQSASN